MSNGGRIGRARFVITVAALIAFAAALWLAQRAGGASGVQPYQTYENTVAADAPVDQYRFDDISGSKSLADSAGTDNGVNHGIGFGGAGPFNGSHAGSFGSGAYAALGTYPLAGDTSFSAEAWINWSGTSLRQQVFDLGSSSSSFMALTPASGLAGSPMMFEIRTATGDYKVTGSTVTANKWAYVAVTEDASGTMKLYLNGAQVGKTTGATVNPSSLGAATNNWIGLSQVSTEPPFKGSISNLAFYPTALSASQVLAHYNAAEFPVNTSAPTVSGSAQDGQTLSANVGSWSGPPPITYSYQWQSCNSSGSGCANVSGATGSTYQLHASDVGTTLDVVVTGSNSAGSSSATSASSAVVAAIGPANTGAPSISGSARDGQTLSASVGSWSGTSPIAYSYQWQSCDSTGNNCANISGATGSTYQLGPGDVGTTLRVVVTGSNGGGSSSASSAPSAAVQAAAPANTSSPTISGSAQDGQTLTASPGSWSGTPPITYSYQWQSCDPTGNNCANVSGATGSTYQLGPGDVGTTLRVVVTGSNGGGSSSASSAPSAAVQAAAPANTSSPTISGSAQDGQTLTASPGSWSGTPPITYSYQWQSCDSTGNNCANVSGATGSTYQLGPGDVGTTLRVVVTGSNGGGSSSASSAPTAAVRATVPANTAAPSISGSAQDGQTLTASPGSWSGTPPITYSYQWQSCDSTGNNCANVSGATGSTYQLGPGDVGTTLVVVVTASNAAGSSNATSAPSAVVQAAAPANTSSPTISGSAQDGQTLTASPGSWSGTPPIAYSYQWQSCDSTGNNCANVSGATGSTYQLGPGDVGTTLRVVVTGSNAAGSSSASSAPTAAVRATVPANTAAPSISGTAQTGQTLAANPGSWSGTPPITFSYQWQSCDQTGNNCANVSGATGSTYQLGPGDVGTTLVVVVTASNAAGSSNATSAPSAVVLAIPANTAAPSISGTAQTGQTLTANPGSWSGTQPITYSYQWQSCDQTGNNCSNLTGATGSTYQLLNSDLGTTLVVVVTASNAVGSSSATSAPSAVVAASAPANTSQPTVTGSVQDGQTLTANPGSWSGTPPLTYSYQWQSCDQTGNNCSNVSSATQPTYQLGPGDVGTTVVVVVTVSNSVGTSAASSAATPVVAAIPPANSSAPSISGAVQVGQTLTASSGTWSGDPVTSYSYQWQNCDPTGNNCWNIAGATGSSYQIPTWALGESAQVTVTASNSGGAASASSVATLPIGGTTSQATTYFPSSIWAQPIPPNAPLDPQSGQMVNELADEAFGVAPTETYNCRQSIYTPWSQWNSAEKAYCHQVAPSASFSNNAYAPTFYTVPAGQPTVAVQIPTNLNLQAAMQAVPIPPGAFPAPGTDGQMIIYQPSSDTMWQLWRAYQSNGQWYASGGGRVQHVSTDPGYFQNVPNVNGSCSPNPQVKYCEQAGWGTAAGTPLLAGLATLAQLQSGRINHAIMLALPDNAPNVWSWPAQHSDGTGDSTIPEGAWFQISPNVNLDAWFASLGRPVAPIERILAQAIQTYGAVVVNTSTGVLLGSENWTPSGNNIFDGPGGLYGGMTPHQFMTDLPWEDMQVLQTNMCNAIQPGSTLYQTPCKPPKYVTPDPNAPASATCPATLSVSPQPGQTTGPSVTITNPTWTNLGSRVTVSTAVSDPSGVTEVDFKVDGQLRFVSNYPFCKTYVLGGLGGFWDVESESYGWHTLEVDAYDSLGYESTASERVLGGTQ